VTGRVQILAIVGSILFLLLVLELVRRRQLAEEFSALWIVSALALLGLSIRRDLIDRFAQAMDIYYAPAALLLGLLAIVAAASLSFSVILSRQQRRLDHLTEETAILAAELREVRRAGHEHDGGEDRRRDAHASGSGPVRPLR
jgi:hypothetical protein